MLFLTVKLSFMWLLQINGLRGHLLRIYEFPKQLITPWCLQS